jgi:hypothetical protein
MDVCVRVSVLCCPVFRWRPCVGLIPQPRSPTKCLWIEKSSKEGQGPIRTVEASGKKRWLWYVISCSERRIQLDKCLEQCSQGTIRTCGRLGVKFKEVLNLWSLPSTAGLGREVTMG